MVPRTALSLSEPLDVPGGLLTQRQTIGDIDSLPTKHAIPDIPNQR